MRASLVAISAGVGWVVEIGGVSPLNRGAGLAIVDVDGSMYSVGDKLERGLGDQGKVLPCKVL